MLGTIIAKYVSEETTPSARGDDRKETGTGKTEPKARFRRTK
jgi:hypothetical protein